jgi:hypothetical protein
MKRRRHTFLKEAISELARPTDGWLWATRSLRSSIGVWGNALAGEGNGWLCWRRESDRRYPLGSAPTFFGARGSRGQSWSPERHSTIPAAKLELVAEPVGMAPPVSIRPSGRKTGTVFSVVVR